MFKLKNDKYRRSRGGYAEFLDIYCGRCNNYLLLYQKDGHGHLRRLYLNRIFHPPELERLQYKSISSARELSDLVCGNCNTTVGHPVLHWEGRYAFVLVRGNFAKKKADMSRHGSPA